VTTSRRPPRAPALDWGRAAIPVDALGRSSPLATATQAPTWETLDWGHAAIPVGPDDRSDPTLSRPGTNVASGSAPPSAGWAPLPRLPTLGEAEAATVGPADTPGGTTPFIDRPIPVRSGPAFTLRQWFAALRAEGIGNERDGDEAAARHFAPLFRPDLARPAGPVGVRMDGPGGAGGDGGAPDPPGGGGAHARKQHSVPVIPFVMQSGGVVDAAMGVAEGAFPLSADSSSELYCEAEYAEFGLYSDMIADLAAMGAGRVRRTKRCDLYWGSLFPREGYAVAKSYQDGERFPKPAELQPKLSEGGWSALLPFQRMVLACLRHGLKLSVTPFHSFGGSPLMATEKEVDGEENIRGGPAGPALCADFTLATWASVSAERPMHQRSVAIATTAGWDPWYWEEVDGGTAGERHYQQFAVNTWPSERGEAVEGYVSDYMLGCARRKALGLAALADALAEYLGRLRRAFRAVGHDLWDVVEEVEFANELDGAFVRDASEVNSEDDPSALGITGDDVARYGALELGRYCTLMSGTFRDRFTRLRFHLGECFNQRPEELVVGARFMRKVADIGMRAEVELWRERQLALLIADRAAVNIAADYADWAACCEGAGYWWPRRAADASELIAFSVTDLVHRAGFHWFHGADSGYDKYGNLGSTAANYYDEVALLDVIAMFRATVLTPLSAQGFDVGLCVNAMGFPALYPPKPPVDSADWFSRTTPIYQAAMLLRWFAVLRAAGVDYASWFTSMRSPADLLGSERDWGTFDAMSLRNDCTIPDSSGHAQRSRALIAFPRPAWYAWQAWVTLMAYCTRLDVVHAAEGCVIIRLTLSGGINEPLHPERTFPYAFLCWVDQYATNRDVHRVGRRTTATAQLVPIGVPPDEVPFGVALLNLIPQVLDTEQSAFGTAAGADANGYAIPARGADWDWAGWHGAVGFHTNGVLQIGTLMMADPGRAPAPICILTDTPVLAGG